jgi:hypothetical protein
MPVTGRPPDPTGTDPLFPSVVRHVEIQHEGCYGTCPIYRARVENSGTFEYEGKRFVRDIGLASGTIDRFESIGLFTWIEGHQGVYAPRPAEQLIPDAEVTTYRFLMKNGDEVTFRTNADGRGDLWVLSHLVDALIAQARQASEASSNGNSRKPAT